MLYLANPTSSTAVHDAMTAGLLGFIDTPKQGNKRLPGVTWCADNGCFSNKWDAAEWWAFLVKNAPDASSCLFATLPDVVGDWAATLAKSEPWIEQLRALGYKAAIVLQNGATSATVPWDRIDAVFVGGDDAFKFGGTARELCREAKARGLWVHVGRINGPIRYRAAGLPYESGGLGADSCDGTYLTKGPDTNLPKLLSWEPRLNEARWDLFGGAA